MALVQSELQKCYIGSNEITKIMKGTTQIRPAGLAPGANTVAYYPLTSTSTVNDMSGNGYNLTNSGNVTFGTYNGVDCASFNGSSSKLTATISTLPQGSNARTFSIWLYYTKSSNSSIMGYGANRTKWGCFVMTFGDNGYGITPYYNDLECGVMTKNSWINVIATYDGTNMKIYINGVLKGTSANITLVTSGTNFEIGNPYSTNYYQGYASNAIIEDKARTEQEISDYYNLTKSNYGL